MAFANWLLSPIGTLTGIIYPFGLDETTSRTARALRWLLHLSLWGIVLATLWQLERTLPMERWLRSPMPTAHRYYLVIAAVAVYSVGWLCRGLWNALRADGMPESNDELADTWNDALATIAHAGISTATTPTFLVIGAPSSAIDGMIGQWRLLRTSPRTNLPFHVYANHDAIVVATDRLSNVATMKSRSGRAPSAQGDREDSFVQLARLCQLIASRCDQPAVQGVLIVLPWEATHGDSNTNGVIEACQADLLTIRETLGLDMPVFYAMVGIHGTLGTTCRRVAAFQPFPPLPDLDPADIPSMWKEGIDRLCLETLPMQLMTTSPTDAESNNGLSSYELASELHMRRSRWLRLLADGTRHLDGEPGMVAGICVAANPLADATNTLWTEMLGVAQTATWSTKAITHAEATAVIARRRFGLGLIAVIAALMVSVWILLGSA